MNQLNHQQLFYKPGISAYSLNQFARSPAHFWRTSSYNPQRVKEEPTDAMKFGIAYHLACLQPEKVDSSIVVAPEINRRTNAGKDEWETFKKLNYKKTIITQDQWLQIQEMRDALWANPDVRDLIGNGCAEEPVCWWREEGGLMCKVKVDYNRRGLVIDLKSTEDSSADDFSKSMSNYGYHRQLAWCKEGAEKQGNKIDGCIIIAQEKTIPSNINIYAVSASAIALGEEENNHIYDEITERMKTKDWSYSGGIKPLDVPRWYKPVYQKEF